MSVHGVSPVGSAYSSRRPSGPYAEGRQDVLEGPDTRPVWRTRSGRAGVQPMRPMPLVRAHRGVARDVEGFRAPAPPVPSSITHHRALRRSTRARSQAFHHDLEHHSAASARGTVPATCRAPRPRIRRPFRGTDGQAVRHTALGEGDLDQRRLAFWLKEQRPTKLDPESVLPQLDQFEAEARSRGITHTTFRHLIEVLNLNGSQRDDLRRLLIDSRPEQYAAPLWSLKQ